MFKHLEINNFMYPDSAGEISVVSLSLYLGEDHHVVICTDKKTIASVEWTAAKVVAYFDLDWHRLIWIERDEKPALINNKLTILASYDFVTFQINPSTREIQDATWRPMLTGDWMELGVPSPSDFSGVK